MRAAFLSAWLLSASLALSAIVRAPHVVVEYEGIDEKWAEAIAQTLSATREFYVKDFAFAMPDVIECSVTCDDKQQTQLFTDGEDRITLRLSSPDKLKKPAEFGTFNIYGLAHELGHIAMYRIVKDHQWMTADAAQGFAHYTGSFAVDRIYEAKGQALWPDAYDYRADGMARFNRNTAPAAALWPKLEQIIGRTNFTKLFEAWNKATIDPANPRTSLEKASADAFPDQKDRLAVWWNDAAPLLIEKRAASTVAKQTIDKSKLTGKPVKLAYDDDTPDGKRSIAGGGHAVDFNVPEKGDWYIVAVYVNGSRYGRPAPPPTQFEIALCDPKLQPIATWKKAYSAFPYGSAKWVKLDVPPTKVPDQFDVCLTFNPTQTSGIFVNIDNSTKGHSVVGTPGKMGDLLRDGDWMIRVEIDKPRSP